MFDYVVCERKLKGSPNVSEWQTKCTPSQYMETYKINKDGKLWFLKVERRYKRDKSRVIGGYFERISEEWVECHDFTGSINFYGHDQSGKWWEVIGLFEDGKLVKSPKVVKGKEQ